MSYTERYLTCCQDILKKVSAQEENIRQAAQWFAESIMAERVVHLFGSGHSRIMVEEMWPRYGSFPGFNPIVELALTNHNQVVGANGQRQAMFLENVSGFAARILRNFKLSDKDSALVISSSGCNIVQIEMADLLQQNGVKVVAMISKLHSEESTSNHPEGKKLSDFADLVLDTGAPLGDAMVKIEGMKSPVSPGSTVGGAILVNCIKAELANILYESGHEPKVLTSGAIIGKEAATELFESAYDEHATRLSKVLNQN